MDNSEVKISGLCVSPSLVEGRYNIYVLFSDFTEYAFMVDLEPSEIPCAWELAVRTWINTRVKQ